ncbi:hypothetical protein [Shewanella sp. 4_MG-2023]|uniref:hypothetical protein n=1 Tax=Shewanella sp. 4_MG-2023 TaxID=3062652 RepID=UPI0026E37E0F|nr:hypothetical protein [Shewanella sp. 4_MG-2023]MDO6677085.1 hypothetical protein [Shewanella sp. 4_MG-2023]
MSIAEKEKELFESWEPQRKGFVKDGVVSEQDYLKSGIKICFILKEVNDDGEDGGGWDLRKYLYDGARGSTWNNVVRWTRVIRAINENIHWHELEDVSDKHRKEQLRSICSMNLKKSPGGMTTVHWELDQAVIEDKEKLRHQYNLYDADITICGGTGWHMLDVLDINRDEIKTTSRGVNYFTNTSGKPVLMYNHPAARTSHAMLTYSLLDAVREILKFTD